MTANQHSSVAKQAPNRLLLSGPKTFKEMHALLILVVHIALAPFVVIRVTWTQEARETALKRLTSEAFPILQKIQNLLLLQSKMLAHLHLLDISPFLVVEDEVVLQFRGHPSEQFPVQVEDLALLPPLYPYVHLRVLVQHSQQARAQLADLIEGAVRSLPLPRRCPALIHCIDLSTKSLAFLLAWESFVLGPHPSLRQLALQPDLKQLHATQYSSLTIRGVLLKATLAGPLGQVVSFLQQQRKFRFLLPKLGKQSLQTRWSSLTCLHLQAGVRKQVRAPGFRP